MKWKSISHIVDTLDLQSDQNKPEDIKKELKRLLKKCHPDKTEVKGGPKSESEKIVCNLLTSALNFMDKNKSNTPGMDLVTVEASRGLLARVTDALVKANEGQAKESLEKNTYETVNAECINIKKSYRWKKITVAVVISTILFVFALPDQIKDHALLAPLLTNQVFVFIWYSVFSLLILYLPLLYYLEARKKKYLEELVSIDLQKEILRVVYEAKMVREKGEDGNEVLLFCRSDLTDIIYEVSDYNLYFSCRYRGEYKTADLDLFDTILRKILPNPIYSNATVRSARYKLKKFLISRLPKPISISAFDRTTQDKIIELALIRYLEKQWIRKFEGKHSLEDWYEIVVNIDD
jgi:hypothetical protein